MNERNGLRWATTGGLLLGLGLGGLVDGILFHQILQWHNLVSSVVPSTTLEAMRTNMLWDGLFQAFAWAMTLAGVLLLWAGARQVTAHPPTGWLLGLLLIGWGLFNLIDGVLSHFVLGIHHVREPGDHLAWDIGVLLSAPVLGGLGWLLAQRSAPRA